MPESPDKLFDICFNFTHSSFRHDEAEVLGRAVATGVDTMMVTGSAIGESRECLALAQRYPEHLWASAGVHPHHAREWDESSADAIRELATNPKVVAVGECGLDYNRNFSTPEQQRYAFEKQLEIAAELRLPAFMHERDAHDDFLRILEGWRNDLPAAVIHCFTGEEEQLEAYLALDLHVGVTGWICDERRGHHLHEFVDRIPADRLMIETDAPYLLPRDLSPKPRDRRNEPAYLPHIRDTVARLRNVSPSTLAAQTRQTAMSFFGLAD
ncbi:MAG TPA: hydrolase TatD [Gammaproteobacteria bacterium]|nr:hydrolase TatD [Gammaproteobacteria bacterium]